LRQESHVVEVKALHQVEDASQNVLRLAVFGRRVVPGFYDAPPFGTEVDTPYGI
jgi:hypothetical protein